MASLNLNKLPWYGQIGIFVVIAAAMLGAFYYFIEAPQQIVLDAKTKELSDIRGRISRGQAMARQLPEFRKEIGTLEARLDALKPILPDERDVGDLLRRVQTLATQSNLQVRGFRPQAITTRELHAEWPIALQLEGNYHNLGMFLDRVSKFPRIINIGGMNLAANNDGGAAASMTISATATTFVLVEPPPAPVEDPAKKGKGAKAPVKKAPAKK
ncbi:MAG: type 4a pilus biogenesis protein PilO [Cyanobacteria bacterium]|nr:type 4a pilus biogenesis protein PilO [Cyanobacteriota bacterium]